MQKNPLTGKQFIGITQQTNSLHAASQAAWSEFLIKQAKKIKIQPLKIFNKITLQKLKFSIKIYL